MNEKNDVPESQVHIVVPTGLGPTSAYPANLDMAPLTLKQPPAAVAAFNPEAQVVNQHPSASSGVPRGLDRPVTIIDKRNVVERG